MVLPEPGSLQGVAPQSRCSDPQDVTAQVVLGPLMGTTHDCYLASDRSSKRKYGTVATGTSEGAAVELMLDMLR